ncbi:MAG TPA: 23S rRNA (uracil(1939)-C(5))-methyltransferase RlmD [Polyangia bacterium]|nr:23S rRNA (uracil(1939)-C(5))-methyltransferase RlmD [Polyangia bacterium]
MLHPGANLVLTVDHLDHDGAGMGDVQTDAGLFRLHVAGALPGEQVRACVVHVSPHAREQGRDAWADLEEIATASPQRVAPPCPAHDHCGGCPLARWAYVAQVEWKRELVVEAMATHEELLGVHVAACVPSPQPFGYRGNAKYVFGHDRDGRLVLGAYAPRSHEIVDMSGCPIGEPALAEVAAALVTSLVQHAVEPFDEVRRTGLLRYVVLRANADGKVLVALVTGRESWPEAETFARELAVACPAVLGVVHNVNRASGNALLGESERLLCGSATIEDTIGPARVRLGPRSFAQANRLVASRAYHDIVAAVARLGLIDRVVDAYAGAGGIALSLAPLAREVVAIEENPAACATAQALLAEREPDGNIRFVIGDVADHLAQVGTADLVVLNPPRQGCAPAVIAAVVQLHPRLVAYLSCNPASLARDLAALARLGLRTLSITPYDMLPHTPHVEALALLEKG